MKRTKYIVKQDCLCQHYIHEITKYPREGLVEKKLLKGDVVELLEEWSNFYGTYLRVEKDGEYYDMLHNNLEII